MQNKNKLLRPIRNAIIDTIKTNIVPLVPKPTKEITFAIRKVFKPLYYQAALNAKPVENNPLIKPLIVKNYNLLPLLLYIKKITYDIKETPKGYTITIKGIPFSPKIKKHINYGGPLTREIAQDYLVYQPLTFADYTFNNKHTFTLRKTITVTYKRLNQKTGDLKFKTLELNKVSFKNKTAFPFNPSSFEKKMIENIRKEIKKNIANRLTIKEHKLHHSVMEYANTIFKREIKKITDTLERT